MDSSQLDEERRHFSIFTIFPGSRGTLEEHSSGETCLVPDPGRVSYTPAIHLFPAPSAASSSTLPVITEMFMVSI